MCAALTFVIGGAASGKSALAERLVRARPAPWVYLATGQAFDDEMRAKIAVHQARRDDGWINHEVPLDLAGALGQVQGHVALIDCMTFWLTNHIFADSDLGAETETLLAALAACPIPVVAVSNEVGQGVVPDTPLGRQFREAQGRLNIALAAQADTVVQVVAGLPNVLKGSI